MEEVLYEIWREYRESYDIYYNKASVLTDKEIYQLLQNIEMVHYQYPRVNMSCLSTCGCEHFYNKGRFTGCSMCNYHSYSIEGSAYLRVLREKNPSLYSDVVKKSFINARGIVKEQLGMEFISGYSFLSDIEFPEELYNKLFLIDPVFHKRPFIYTFETRLDSITEDKIQMITNKLGKGRIIVQSGIEVKDEWIRNHWINKKINDQDIVQSIKILHDNRIKFKGEMIFGIPGFTETNSIHEFVNTVLWMDEIGCDYIAVMPLNRKQFTLQNFIHKHLKDDPYMIEVGLADGEHTGLPWMISLIKGLCLCFDHNPKVAKKIGFGQYDISLNSINNELGYNYDNKCKCLEEIKNTLIEFNITNNAEIIYKLYNKLECDTCFSYYAELLKKQSKIGDSYANMKLLANRITKIIWNNDNTQIHKFYEEMKQR